MRGTVLAALMQGTFHWGMRFPEKALKLSEDAKVKRVFLCQKTTKKRLDYLTAGRLRAGLGDFWLWRSQIFCRRCVAIATATAFSKLWSLHYWKVLYGLWRASIRMLTLLRPRAWISLCLRAEEFLGQRSIMFEDTGRS